MEFSLSASQLLIADLYTTSLCSASVELKSFIRLDFPMIRLRLRARNPPAGHFSSPEHSRWVTLLKRKRLASDINVGLRKFRGENAHGEFPIPAPENKNDECTER